MSIFTPNTNNDFKIAIKYYFNDSCLNDNNNDISIIDFSGIGREENNVGKIDGVDNSNSIENWDTTNIDDMSFTFNVLNFNKPDSKTNVKTFNKNISNWDVSNVKDMINMFSGCTSCNHKLYDSTQLKKLL